MSIIRVSDIPGTDKCRRWTTSKLTREERETHINIDGNDIAYLFSSIPKHIRRFVKRGYRVTGVGALNGEVIEAEFEIPAKLITFRNVSALHSKKPAGAAALAEYRARLAEEKI